MLTLAESQPRGSWLPQVPPSPLDATLAGVYACGALEPGPCATSVPGEIPAPSTASRTESFPPLLLPPSYDESEEAIRLSLASIIIRSPPMSL